jgi:hypothetical protein
MSYFAQVVDGIVSQVIAAEKEIIATFLNASSWFETDLNTEAGVSKTGGIPLRGNYAGIGYVYDDVNDVFYTPQPYVSWTLNNTTWTWEAPTPMPTEGGPYKWDEPTLSWIQIDISTPI